MNIFIKYYSGINFHYDYYKIYRYLVIIIYMVKMLIHSFERQLAQCVL
jgi:hypothetical protein